MNMTHLFKSSKFLILYFAQDIALWAVYWGFMPVCTWTALHHMQHGPRPHLFKFSNTCYWVNDTRCPSNQRAVTFKRQICTTEDWATLHNWHITCPTELLFELTTNVQRKSKTVLRSQTMLSCCHDITLWIPFMYRPSVHRYTPGAVPTDLVAGTNLGPGAACNLIFSLSILRVLWHIFGQRSCQMSSKHHHRPRGLTSSCFCLLCSSILQISYDCLTTYYN